jgi:type II secretory pathway pseudopilin PulG
VISRVRVRLRASAGDDHGFTIVEATISMVLLMVLSTVVLGAVLATLRLADQVRSRTVATEIATGTIADARRIIDNDIATVASMLDQGDRVAPTDVEVDGRTFQVTRAVVLDPDPGGGSACARATANAVPQLSARIRVTVSWGDRGVFAPVQITERAMLPQSLTAESSGRALVAVRVQDPTVASGAEPVSGVDVALTSGTVASFTGRTDAEGCVLILVTGSHAGEAFTATGTKVGYVNEAWDGVAKASVGGLVYGGAINQVELRYARAATLLVHVTDADGTRAATDAEAAGEVLTLLASASGTAASAGWIDTLTGATYTVRVWPSRYSAYLGTELPPGLDQVTVDGGAAVDIWVRPGVGVVPAPVATP